VASFVVEQVSPKWGNRIALLGVIALVQGLVMGATTPDVP